MTNNETNVPVAETAPPYCKELLKLVGDFWTVRIVSALESDDLRFCAIERALGDSNPATLANRLKKLEQHGLIARRVVGSDTLYTLTRNGMRLVPVFTDLKRVAGEMNQ